MDFNLSNEQELLRDGLSRFLATRYDLERNWASWVRRFRSRSAEWAAAQPN